jgi:hypothetical protein
VTVHEESTMGKLVYGSHEIDIDDRLLTHLQVVAINRLKREKPFSLSWRDSRDQGGGRTTLWVHPSIPLLFHFEGSRIPSINRAWLAQLEESADGAMGMIVTSEPPESDDNDCAHLDLAAQPFA